MDAVVTSPDDMEPTMVTRHTAGGLARGRATSDAAAGKPTPPPQYPAAAADAAQREAVAAWLADSLNRPDSAREQWASCHLAVLALGKQFSAVRLASELVYAVAAGGTDLATASTVLQALDGPVIHDMRGRRFYALVPPSSPGPELGRYATYLGFGNYIGVPRVGDNEPDEHLASYWAVPMTSPGALCYPVRVAKLAEAGTAELDGQVET
ncbi:hypothetical protein [Streptomyces sp. NPDC056682]|uniref:hypothetical protein n=1 Tax=Streptomyces sp. NPDC056682 TaxID=3345909 RepID=UPI00369A980B